MSDEATLVSAGHFAYVAEHTRADDAFLEELKAAALAAGLPRIWISPAQASLLQVLLRLAQAREVVEVGTLAGYSAIAMARALPPAGRVRTIEVADAHADFAERWIARSDVAGRVEVLRGRGVDVLPTLASDSADAAFLDADKASYPLYLEQCLRIVRVGGLIAVDNAFAFGQLLDAEPADRDVPAIRAFNDQLAADPRLQAVIVPLGDGCWVGARLR
jgi:predicted O-methyltransferase YrrM